MSKKPTSKDKIAAPRDWDKAVSVAYLRLLGQTQEDAGKANGLTRCTVGEWEKCSWWKDVIAEASSRWLYGLTAKARETLLEGLDPNLSLKVLERILPELAPATQKIGSDPDKPVVLKVIYDD